MQKEFRRAALRRARILSSCEIAWAVSTLVQVNEAMFQVAMPRLCLYSLCAVERIFMLRMLLHWFVSALAVWITSRVVPGFYVDGAAAALIAAVVIGLVNATVGLFLKIITFPLTILTLGLFWFVINAIMLELASTFVPGFHITGFRAAFLGGIVLTLVNMLLKWLVMPSPQR